MTSRQGQVASLYRIDITLLSSLAGISHRLRWRSSLNGTLPRCRFRNALILTGGWGNKSGLSAATRGRKGKRRGWLGRDVRVEEKLRGRNGGRAWYNFLSTPV